MKMNLSKRISKKTILYIFVFFWLIFSTGYIVWNVFNNFRNVSLFNAYEQGRVDTIDFLVREAEECQPVPVFGSEKQIRLINIDCLQEEIGQ